MILDHLEFEKANFGEIPGQVSVEDLEQNMANTRDTKILLGLRQQAVAYATRNCIDYWKFDKDKKDHFVHTATRGQKFRYLKGRWDDWNRVTQEYTTRMG